MRKLLRIRNWPYIYPLALVVDLTNQPDFFMVCTLIDHRNDAIKCSKLKWNYEPQESGFTAMFWTFYGIISMVYKRADLEKVWLVRCFLFTITRTTFSRSSFTFRCKIVKTKSARVALQIASFSWSLLLSTIALNQAACKKFQNFAGSPSPFVFTLGSNTVSMMRMILAQHYRRPADKWIKMAVLRWSYEGTFTCHRT